MSTNHQASDEAVAPKAPTPCEMGCGFFGSEATGNCCSKCFLEKMKKSHSEAAAEKKCTPIPTVDEKVVETKAQEPATWQEQQIPKPDEERPTHGGAPLKKKKKKKTTYKNLMAQMTSGSGDKDVQKERETIQGLGGGNFTKIERI